MQFSDGLRGRVFIEADFICSLPAVFLSDCLSEDEQDKIYNRHDAKDPTYLPAPLVLPLLPSVDAFRYYSIARWQLKKDSDVIGMTSV